MKYYKVTITYLYKGRMKHEELIIDDASDLGGIFKYGDCSEGEVIEFHGIRKEVDNVEVYADRA
jgi:hypothetical protein